jgi:hypothetical protein
MSRGSLRALSAKTRAWQDEVSRTAKANGMDVLRIGVNDQETAIAMSEFIAERRLRKV